MAAVDRSVKGINAHLRACGSLFRVRKRSPSTLRLLRDMQCEEWEADVFDFNDHIMVIDRGSPGRAVAMVEYILLGTRKLTLYVATSCTERGYRRTGLSSLLRLVLFMSARQLGCVRIASEAVTAESKRMLAGMGFASCKRTFHGYPYNMVLRTDGHAFAKLLRRMLRSVGACELPPSS